MTLEKTTPPPVLAAQHPKQKYHKPTFEVIDLNAESPLLSGSSKQPAKINPLTPGGDL